MSPLSLLPVASGMMLLLATSAICQVNPRLMGVWMPIDEKDKILIEIFEAADGTLAGKLLGKLHADGTIKPAVGQGQTVFWGFRSSGSNTWDSGHFRDPKRGIVVPGRLDLRQDGKIESEAQIAFFTQKTTWVKVKDCSNLQASNP